MEVRGPIGGWFVRDEMPSSPLLLVAGGSGIVPLISMLRYRAALDSRAPTRLVYSSHDLEHVIYRGELERLKAGGSGLEVFHVLTMRQPPGWQGYSRRIEEAMLAEVAWPADLSPDIFVCGPTPMVKSRRDRSAPARACPSAHQDRAFRTDWVLRWIPRPCG